VPSRTKTNQMYVPQLDRIVLKDAMGKRPFASTQTCKCVIRVYMFQERGEEGCWMMPWAGFAPFLHAGVQVCFGNVKCMNSFT